MDLRHINNTRTVLTLSALNYVDCERFFVLILSILFIIEPNNFKKSYSWISEKQDQTSINLSNVFNFIGSFSNYVGFGEIKWLCAFIKYTTQKFITKLQSKSMSWY